MSNRASTRAVLRNLDRETGIWESAGIRFSNQSLDLFTDNSNRWLRDRSELKDSTLESADWREVYAYFRDMAGEATCEGHESLDGAHMGETVYCDGSCVA